MTEPSPIHILGVAVHPWTTAQTLDAIDARLSRGEFTQHVVVNVAKLVNARTDTELDNAIRNCDIVNVDGMGVVWGGLLLGLRIPERVTGIDLFLELLTLAQRRGEPVYFLGAKPDVVERAVTEIRRRYPALSIAGWNHGYFWDDEQAVVDRIRASGASMLFVALTSPLKERFIDRWQSDLGVTFAMGVGGTFDVLAGVTRRAPRWMQRYGLEWLFRLGQEPRRMWRRYVRTNAIFAWLLMRESLKRRTAG